MSGTALPGHKWMRIKISGCFFLSNNVGSDAIAVFLGRTAKRHLWFFPFSTMLWGFFSIGFSVGWNTLLKQIKCLNRCTDRCDATISCTKTQTRTHTRTTNNACFTPSGAVETKTASFWTHDRKWKEKNCEAKKFFHLAYSRFYLLCHFPCKQMVRTFSFFSFDCSACLRCFLCFKCGRKTQ